MPPPLRSSAWSDWKADLSYFREEVAPDDHLYFLTNRTLWAIAHFRFGQWLRSQPWGPPVMALRAIHRLTGVLVQITCGVELPPETQIGPGLRIYHGGNVVINSRAVIGARCTLRQGVTIGNARTGGGSPCIGDDVECGTYAQILGEVTIGDGARIGSMAVVLTDVPTGATAVGVPARIIPTR